MLDFSVAKRLYDNGQFNELLGQDGLYFLMLRSMSRTEMLRELAEVLNINIDDVPSRELFRFMYEQDINLQIITRVIGQIYNRERQQRRDVEADLINQLYRLASFDWGGLHQNSLEKTIVDNYVKKIKSYDDICEKIDNELHTSLKGYVLCSWYNHWTSIIIEDIFKDHDIVLPTVGLVKKIDFFINNVPFDLKVTYFPEGFLSERRRADGLRPELTVLKRVARALGIPFNSSLRNAQLLEDLWRKVDDHPEQDATECINELKEYRDVLVTSTVNDPTGLIKWLYENQGVRRFDASNRLFLVIINKQNYFEAWKLKRAKPLLLESINAYLDSCNNRQVGRNISFNWDEKEYSVLSDAIFVVKEQ